MHSDHSVQGKFNILFYLAFSGEVDLSSYENDKKYFRNLLKIMENYLRFKHEIGRISVKKLSVNLIIRQLNTSEYAHHE